MFHGLVRFVLALTLGGDELKEQPLPKEVTAELKGHVRGVTSVAFSPKGDLLASASWDNAVRLWAKDGKSWKEKAKLPGGPSGLAFSPDGRWLACGTEGKQLALWDLKGPGPKLHAKRPGHQGRPFAVAFSPDGKKLVSGSFGPLLRLWNFAEGETDLWALYDREEGPARGVTSLAFGADSQRLAFTRLTGEDGLWLLALSKDGTDELPVPRSPARLVSWSADGKAAAIVAGAKARVIQPQGKEWKLGKNFDLPPGEGPAATCKGLALSANGAKIAAAGPGKTVALWADSDKKAGAWELPAEVNCVAFSPDAELLAVGCAQGAIYLLSSAAGTIPPAPR